MNDRLGIMNIVMNQTGSLRACANVEKYVWFTRLVLFLWLAGTSSSSNSCKETYSSTEAEIPPECLAAVAIASTCTTAACTVTTGAQAACLFGEAFKE